MERLDKFLSNAGAGTRSQVKQYLRQGLVTVDGAAVTDGSIKVDPQAQEICFRGESLKSVGTVVLMLNKPAGFVTATEDPKEKTVMELLPEKYRHMDLKPVGRLDKLTEGLLLFTNDGDLLHNLITPKKGVQKVYYARHSGIACSEDVAAFAQGLTLADGTLCRSARLQILGPGECLVTVQEGKYHQVRRMMASRGLPVEYLERRQEGSLVLGDLPRGKTRELTSQEIKDLEK